MGNGLISTVLNFCKRNANTIFGILGCVGVGATAVCASIATKNALEVLEEHERECLSTKEKVKLVWPEYIWTGIVGLGTCGSIIVSNVYSARKAAALSAALLITKEQLDTTRDVFNDYRKETLKYLPQDPEELNKIQKIIDRRPALEPGQKSKYIRDHYGDIIHFKEADTGIEFDCRLIDLEKGLIDANKLMEDQDYCALNMFHELIPNVDVPISNVGWSIGWQRQYDGVIEFTTTEHMERGPNGEGIIISTISYSRCPHDKYN